MNGACFSMHSVTREGSCRGGRGQGQLHVLVRIRWRLVGLQKLREEMFKVGFDDRTWKPSLRIHLSLGRPG